jgi:uncharacterized membrane protein (DUF373 family)
MAAPRDSGHHPPRVVAGWLRRGVDLVEFGVVIGLWVIAAAVLIHTIVQFARGGSSFANLTVQAIDGVLVVVIILDLAHTVLGQLHSSVIPVRPFLFIGILAGVRDVLSASARLSFGSHPSDSAFHQSIVSLGVGIGVVVALVLALLVLDRTDHEDQVD